MCGAQAGRYNHVWAEQAQWCAGVGLVMAHAALRAPNLKARLATQARAREEFRAVWRGYAQQHDYTA